LNLIWDPAVIFAAGCARLALRSRLRDVMQTCYTPVAANLMHVFKG
jgi:hypothetical protein